jgi:hypothetical protein
VKRQAVTVGVVVEATCGFERATFGRRPTKKGTTI